MTAFLYVEDDPFSRDVMNVILTRLLKYSDVTIFEDSTDFPSRFDALPQRPDIIFVDIHMQPSNGFEVLKMVRRHPDHADTPVIALTASVMNEEILMLRTAGFNGMVAKPVDQEAMPQIIEKALNHEPIWRTP